MSVTASFQPEQLAAPLGEITTLSLHLHNSATTERVVTLRASGDLEAQTTLASQMVRLDAGEHSEVPVTIDAAEPLPPGTRHCVVDVMTDDGTTTASATVEVGLAVAWSARLEPVQSASGTAGRHDIAIDNHSTTPIAFTFGVVGETDVVAEVADSYVTVDGLSTERVALRVTPPSLFWNGPPIEHPFKVSVAAGEEDAIVLEGLYVQRPRIHPWVGPAVAGMVGSLLLFALLWWTLLRPAVEDIARDEAEELDLAQQTELDERVAAIQAAAEESARLPLGEPTDLRMSVSAEPATTSSDAYDFDQRGLGRVLSITDVVFQNPTGAVGRVELLRDGQVLLDQELANFRDLDFHFVAPIQVDSESTIALRVTCATPGPGTADCEAAATIIGFVDDL